jgi:hypothetical protein
VRDQSEVIPDRLTESGLTDIAVQIDAGRH